MYILRTEHTNTCSYKKLTCKEESGESDSTNKGTVSQCIPVYCKLYFLNVYQVLHGKSNEGE